MLVGVRSISSAAAIVAALGLMAGTSAFSAKAADLGGDCCADLEERVAELEATTARKGNRRMSLTVSGQVNRSILYWSADTPGPVSGETSGVYAGLDNDVSSTRFVFSGKARISPSMQAGFEFMTEWAGGAATNEVSQDNVDGGTSGDGNLRIRTANWWLEDKNFGRLTVGRLDLAGPVATIDLGGVSIVASNSPGLVGGGFFTAGGLELGALVGPTYGSNRNEGIRWDSPNIGGFVVQAAWGEDDVWTASLRYAGEFGGIRVAAGIGYLEQDPVNFAGGLDSSSANRRFVESEWSGSAALMHMPSGLFAQGHYAVSEYENGEEGNIWMIQAGITKNWTGLGNTSFYGEYGEAEDYVKASDVAVPFDSEVNFYGVGVVQKIDAAAMELFLGWRRFETEVSLQGVGSDNADLDLVHGGARIKF